MSTKSEFKWKPGKLQSVLVRKVENGFAVRVSTGGNLYDYSFADYVGVLQLMNECFYWDMVPKEEVVAEPVAQKFPATFRRFEARGAEVRAVFVESNMQWSRNAKELDERIEWLRIYEHLSPTELAQWNAVLAEVRGMAKSGARDSTSASDDAARRLRAGVTARMPCPDA